MAKIKHSKKQLSAPQEFRRLGALLEHVDEKVGLIAEQHSDVKKDIGSIKKTLDSHSEMIGELAVGLGIVRGDMETVKGDLEGIKEDLGSVKRTQESHTEMIGGLNVDVAIIKEDVEFIKNSLKKKVDYDEFSALERRVLLLEKRR